jgi:hypothetical protein
LKEKHIQRWDLLSGISPRPVLILARVGAGQRDFYTPPKLPARFVLMNPLWSNRVPVKLAHSIAAAHLALSSSATAALINLRNHGFYEKL